MQPEWEWSNKNITSGCQGAYFVWVLEPPSCALFHEIYNLIRDNLMSQSLAFMIKVSEWAHILNIQSLLNRHATLINLYLFPDFTM